MAHQFGRFMISAAMIPFRMKLRHFSITARQFTVITKVEGNRKTAKQKISVIKDEDHDHEEEQSKDGKLPASCGPENTGLDEEDEMESMFVQGPSGMEWGGPTRGGQRPEPTRFGDWERKGRASDF